MYILLKIKSTCRWKILYIFPLINNRYFIPQNVAQMNSCSTVSRQKDLSVIAALSIFQLCHLLTKLGYWFEFIPTMSLHRYRGRIIIIVCLSTTTIELVQFPHSLSQNYLTLPARGHWGALHSWSWPWFRTALCTSIGLLYMTVVLWFTTMWKSSDKSYHHDWLTLNAGHLSSSFNLSCNRPLLCYGIVGRDTREPMSLRSFFVVRQCCEHKKSRSLGNSPLCSSFAVCRNLKTIWLYPVKTLCVGSCFFSISVIWSLFIICSWLKFQSMISIVIYLPLT